MAKGQKRSSREIRKPKAVKPPPPVAGIALFKHGSVTPIAPPKKKG